jgi:hypothetical protein
LGEITSHWASKALNLLQTQYSKLGYALMLEEDILEGTGIVVEVQNKQSNKNEKCILGLST